MAGPGDRAHEQQVIKDKQVIRVRPYAHPIHGVDVLIRMLLSSSKVSIWNFYWHRFEFLG